MARVRIENLSFSYPGSERKVLDNVSFDIEDGSLVLLCGMNGSGKTTLLRHLKSQLVPEGDTSGTIYFDDVPLDSMSHFEQASKIGYVSQNPEAQFVTDKVWHEIAFGLESIGCDNSTMRSRIAEMSSFFNIEEWFDESTHDLSGGQQQLVALASASVLSPDLLVLDNPISQLDPLAASDFITTLRKVNLELGVTVLFTGQKLEEIYKHADKVVVLENGKVAYSGTPLEVAKALYENNDQMKYSLPSPIRLYHGLRSLKDIDNCPLTIRDFRAWLNREAKKVGITVHHLPDKRASSVNKIVALEFDKVSFRHAKEGKNVLNNLSLSVTRGSLHAIVGDNGSGKTTALKIACGAIRDYYGRVLLYGHKINRMRNSDLYQTGIGMLPQNLKDVFTKQTVREELAEMLAFKNLSADELDLEVKSIAHGTGILGLLDRNPQQLSQGEKQLVAITKMLMRDLKVLLLDDPTKTLDSLSKRKIARVLHELTDRGVTIIMASHDLEFVAKYATNVSMLFEGSVITSATPQAFFSSNTFYTTAASRLSRDYFDNAVTDEEVFILCQENGL